MQNMKNTFKLRLILWLIGGVVIYATPKVSYSQSNDLLIFGGAGNKEFLGCLNCPETSENSIWNEFSQFGWRNSFGKWNSFGQYKNPFSTYSACGEFSSNAPIIVNRQGRAIARLTLNEFTTGSVCGISGNSQLCQALKIMCADQ